MYAVEFEAQIDQGIIHIPVRFQKMHNKSHAKIIIMVDEADGDQDNLALQQFLDNGKKVDQIIAFDRADLHDR